MNSKDKPAKKKKRRIEFCYNFVKFTGAIPVLFWIRPKVVYCGTQKKKHVKGGALVVANHVSMTDPLSILCALWYRIPRFIATKEVFDTKRKNSFFTLMHCIKVDRENFNMSTFYEVSDELAAKKVVVIFPEGEINQTGSKSPMPFKSGAILMAHKNNVPVVPVCIVKREKWYQSQVILFGDPINVAERVGAMPSLAALNALNEEIQATEAELLQKYLSKKGS